MSKTTQLHTLQKFEHLLQDATKIFSLTQPCHQQSMFHKQSTSMISCILPQNAQEKQETSFICIFTNVNWNTEKLKLLYTVKTVLRWKQTYSHLAPTQPRARHSPKAIQLHSVAGSPQQGPAERRMCLVTGWFPGFQTAAVSWPSRAKYGQRKALTACPWVGSTPI